MHQLLLCTCPDQNTADNIATQLLNEQLAACVNILPGIRSVYRWQGQIENAQEHLLLIKTHDRHYAAIEAAIKKLHPYQIPEIIAIAIERGSKDYIKWIDTCLQRD
ncbi:divalent-cation tolerance protein CutA [Methylomonas sp. AM2-LC]|uniref:divalent-cation tolerance protein CutA n=1 Tax=Methylomonas sp. AM2-LC TaxID=3153301 RepID=UPI003264ADF3